MRSCGVAPEAGQRGCGLAIGLLPLTAEVLATDVEFTAALVTAESGEYLLRKVRGVTFNGSARTQTKDRQNQTSEVSSLRTMLGLVKRQTTAKRQE